MYRVVLPIDGDEKRAKRATAVMKSLPGFDREAEVHLLNVFESIDARDDSGGPGLDAEELYERSKPPNTVHEVESALQEAGLDVTVHRRLGKPAAEIIDFVKEMDADHVVIAGRSRSLVGKIIFGSVAQRVLLDAPVPVTLAPSHEN
jgi:nucleotide-binding universal stress UspA family protein